MLLSSRPRRCGLATPWQDKGEACRMGIRYASDNNPDGWTWTASRQFVAPFEKGLSLKVSWKGRNETGQVSDLVM